MYKLIPHARVLNSWLMAGTLADWRYAYPFVDLSISVVVPSVAPSTAPDN